MITIPWSIPARLRWFRPLWVLARGITSDGDAVSGARDDDAALNQHLQDAYEAFVHHHERQILNYLWRMTGDEQGAYDLTQETFLRAWEHFQQISHYAQPRSWLFRVATNLALTYRRRRSSPIGSAAPLDGTNDPAGSDPTGHFDESDQVRTTLLALPPKRRAALVLREVYGLETEEAARVLGMSVAALKMTLSRARAQFRQIYRAQEAHV